MNIIMKNIHKRTKNRKNKHKITRKKTRKKNRKKTRKTQPNRLKKDKRTKRKIHSRRKKTKGLKSSKKIIDVPFSSKNNLGTLASEGMIDYNYQHTNNPIQFLMKLSEKKKIKNFDFFFCG